MRGGGRGAWAPNLGNDEQRMDLGVACVDEVGAVAGPSCSRPADVLELKAGCGMVLGEERARESSMVKASEPGAEESGDRAGPEYFGAWAKLKFEALLVIVIIIH